jgi:hypothetical protein
MAYSHYPSPQPERPVIVTVVAILAIVAGALVLLSLPFSLLQMSGAVPMAGSGGQFMQDPTVRNWMVVTTSASSIVAVLQIAAGIGLLRMRRWAWMLAIALTVVGMAYQIAAAIGMRSVDLLGKIWSSMGVLSDPNMAAMMQRMTTAMMAAGLIFWLAAYGTALVLLTRPSVREAFADR